MPTSPRNNGSSTYETATRLGGRVRDEMGPKMKEAVDTIWGHTKAAADKVIGKKGHDHRGNRGTESTERLTLSGVQGQAKELARGLSKKWARAKERTD